MNQNGTNHRDAALAKALELENPIPRNASKALLLDAEIMTGLQTRAAIAQLYGDPSRSIAFPHRSVHKIVGKVAPGSLAFVMASTGQGKTTFMLDVLDRWAEAGVRIDYLGTEQEPDELRRKWAALRCDIPASVVINLEFDEHADGDLWREQIAEDLARIEDAYGQQVQFHPEKHVNLATIQKAAQEAAQRCAHVLIIDHIDRVETGATENEYLALKRMIQRLKELARENNLVIIAASQVNRKGREGDRIAVYRPPQLHHMQGGATKEHEADVVLGLWRPLRNKKSNEAPKEFKAVMAMAAKGEIEPRDFLEPNTMAVVCLKHRTRGVEGERCKLTLRHGRLLEIPEADHYTTAHGRPYKEG